MAIWTRIQRLLLATFPARVMTFARSVQATRYSFSTVLPSVGVYKYKTARFMYVTPRGGVERNMQLTAGLYPVSWLFLQFIASYSLLLILDCGGKILQRSAVKCLLPASITRNEKMPLKKLTSGPCLFKYELPFI